MGKIKCVKFAKSFLLCGCILGGLCFASCSDNDEFEPMGNVSKGSYEVSLDVAIDNPSSTSSRKVMTRVAVAEDEANGLKTTWESNDRLTVAYKSGGTMKTAELTAVSINGNSATFHGSVESSADAQAFKTSTLYAVNNKATDKIEALIEDNKLKVSVDLSGQDGSVGSVADYDLLYAKGTATSGLRFSHKMCVVRMDFVCEASVSSGSALNDASFIYIPTTSTDRSIFADNATFNFGEDGETAGYGGITFFSPKITSIPLKDGKASVYMVVPENDKQSGELSVKVKCDNGNNFCRYINIEEKSFPAQKVVAKTLKLKADNRTPNIGDYLYSDGTWGPLVYYTDKYPVALVFSNYTSHSDREKGFTHGYAVGLRDAAWPTPWGPDNTDYPEAENLFEHIDATAPLTMMNNLDGLSLSKTLYEKYLKQNGWDGHYDNHVPTAAISVAMEYGGSAWRRAFADIAVDVPIPSNTSGWYLPSVGQWFLMFANLSGLDPNKLQIAREYYSGNVYSLSWLFSSANEKSNYLRIFTNYFSSYENPILGQYYSDGRIPQSTFYLPSDGQIDWYLWACDEAKSDGTACCVRLTQTEIGFTYLDKRQGTYSQNGYAARSVIAF